MPAERQLDERIMMDERIQDLAEPVECAAPRSWPPARAQSGRPWRNRRRSERVNMVSSEVLVSIDQEPANVIDLSVGGIQFRTNHRLTPGSTVLLHILWRDEGRSSLALGRVVWAIYEKPARFTSAHYRVGAWLEQSDVSSFRRVVQRFGVRTTNSAIEVVSHRW